MHTLSAVAKGLMIGATILTLGMLGGVPAQADPKPHVIVGTTGNDILFGSHKSDLILALPGNDRLFGGRGNDFLSGGRGHDVLRDGGRHSGTDLLRGGSGRDRCVGDRNDRFIGCEVVVIR